MINSEGYKISLAQHSGSDLKIHGQRYLEIKERQLVTFTIFLYIYRIPRVFCIPGDPMKRAAFY